MCVNFLRRSYRKEAYFYCKAKRKKITLEDCKKCEIKTYKISNKIRKQSKKQKNKEAKRYSIITDNLEDCYLCSRKKKDMHEAIGGCNRSKSIEWGLVLPLCRKCHSELENNQELKRKIQQLGQETFEIKYSHELFMEEFKRNYIE